MPLKSKSRQEVPAGGIDGDRHIRHHHGVRWEALMPRLARPTTIPGLLGVVVSATLAAAVIAYFTQGVGSSSSGIYSKLLVHPTSTTHEAPTSLAAGGNTAVVLQEGEDGSSSSSIPPSSSLIGNKVKERLSSRGDDDDGGVKQGSSHGGGGDGGGGDGVGGVKQSDQADDAEERRSPNVIFILIDDVGMNDMGASSTHLSVATPFMESLAEDGVLLSRYYTCKVTGRRHRVSSCRSAYFAGPWWLLTLDLRRRSRETALLFPES